MKLCKLSLLSAFSECTNVGGCVYLCVCVSVCVYKWSHVINPSQHWPDTMSIQGREYPAHTHTHTHKDRPIFLLSVPFLDRGDKKNPFGLLLRKGQRRLWGEGSWMLLSQRIVRQGKTAFRLDDFTCSRYWLILRKVWQGRSRLLFFSGGGLWKINSVSIPTYAGIKPKPVSRADVGVETGFHGAVRSGCRLK